MNSMGNKAHKAAALAPGVSGMEGGTGLVRVCGWLGEGSKHV